MNICSKQYDEITYIEELSNAFESTELIKECECSIKMKSLLFELICSPSDDKFSALYSSNFDALDRFVNVAKLILKNCFFYLSSDARRNLLLVAERLFKNGFAINPLIVNIVRNRSYDYELYLDFFARINKKCLSEGITPIYNFPDCESSTNDFSIGVVAQFGRDVILRKTYETPASRDVYFSILEQETNKVYLIANLSFELENFIVFYINCVSDNHDFYVNLLLENLITNIDIAKDVLRFLMRVFYTSNWESHFDFVIIILSRFKFNDYLLYAVFFDLLYNKNSSVTYITPINFMEFSIQRVPEIMKFLKGSVQITAENRSSLNENLARNRSETILNILGTVPKQQEKTIYLRDTFRDMDFFKLKILLNEIKMLNKPLIEVADYEEIITASVQWDGYMRVFLWQVLSFQKILFGYNIVLSSVETVEAEVCYELYANISFKTFDSPYIDI